MLKDFVSNEERSYRIRFGKQLASSLSGFIAGATFASIVWALIVYFGSMFGQL